MSTLTYDEAGLNYVEYDLTFNGYGGGTRPALRVEVGFGGWLYEELLDSAYDPALSYDTSTIHYTGIAATGQTLTYGSEVGYGGAVTAALDPTPDEWTDLSAYVRNVSIRRGNENYLLRQFEAGSCQITFDDPDSRFLPSNTASPYYPWVRPSRPMRVVAVWSDAEVELFRGMTQRWQQNYGRNLASTEVILTCVDTMALMERYDVDQTTLGANGDTPHARITALLDDTGPYETREAWPIALRDIDTNSTATVEQAAAETVPLLDAIKEVLDSEWGLFYISKDGKATYRGREAANPGSTGVVDPNYYFADTDTVTVGADTFSSGRYDTIEVESDDGNLTNLVIVETAYGVEGGWQYEESIEEFEEQRLRVTTLLATQGEAETLASFILNNQYDPLLRIRRLGFFLGGSTASTSTALGVELLSRVEVRQTVAGGVALLLRGVVFGLEYEISREQWYVTMTFGSEYSDGTASVIGSAVT